MTVLIKSLSAYSEYDSGGNLTLAGQLVLNNGQVLYSSIPNHLANDTPMVYIDTNKAVKYINELLAPKLININPLEYKKIDLWLDSADNTGDKQVLGVNSTLLVSKLIYRAAASLSGLPLYQLLNNIFKKNFYETEIKKIPIPIITLISGALHGSSSLNFQEFSVVFSSSLNYKEASLKGSELHQELEKVFKYRNIFSGVGADGAYVPNLSSNFDALEIIKEAILKNGYKIGLDIFFVLDIAARYFYKGGKYYISEEMGSADSSQMIELYEKIFKEYRFLILEDPFIESDTKAWQQVVAKFGDKAYILGDDLLSTNPLNLKKAIKDNQCTMADVKITLQPTIWKVFDFVSQAKHASMKTALSQTAIETNDDFISDLAVALQCDYVKFGPIVRGERVAKHNRLLYIESKLFNG